MTAETKAFLFEMVFLLSACGFFISLKMLSSPKNARLGNFYGALAMAIAVMATVLWEKPKALLGIGGVMALGSLAGIYSAKKVPMTAMPQMVALFNGFGGLASVLVALSEAIRLAHSGSMQSSLFVFTTWFSIAVGAITFTGSVVAFLKLQELMPSRPILVAGQRVFTGLLMLVAVALLAFLMAEQTSLTLLLWLTLVTSILGVLLVIPIGGADMPVVISLLNSYSGLAALAAGFVVKSNLLIIAGALVGASGVILTRLMCQAMNRSLGNVIFGAFGHSHALQSGAEDRPQKEFSPMDAAMLLHNATKVIVVPGYGLAVSQAQSSLRELADAIKASGGSVSYAIHPVAGRMPGHMNVLLAEADIPYQELFDLDEINSQFENADVAVIVGANDVVNPSARTDKSSPLFGMPILNADKAKAVIVLKRGRGRGFAGVENSLFSMENTGLVFGDAKQSLVKISAALKELQN